MTNFNIPACPSRCWVTESFLKFWNTNFVFLLEYFNWLFEYFNWLSEYFNWLSVYFNWLLDYFNWLLEYFNGLLEYFNWLREYFNWLLEYLYWLLEYFKKENHFMNLQTVCYLRNILAVLNEVIIIAFYQELR